MHSFVAALRFLTILPIPGAMGTESGDLAASTPCFPLVGLLIGLCSVPAAWLFVALLPPAVAALPIITLLFAFSGGLHLDGLADTADGLFSARPREEMLAIMRDSRIGAMGVIALVILLLLKAASLASMDPDRLLAAVLLMPVAGRCAILVMMAVLPYARPEGGLGTLFYTRRSRLTGLWGGVFFLACSVLAAGPGGLAVAAFTLLVLLVFALFLKKRLGGATGDTLGASCELAELCVALAFSCTLWGQA
ncbi:MAG TPA: adenosylcobinamide-GDP ribazoletransferase [Desulfobulbus sp.]|nr:adenosylcobinamide-GDP ribazoletransferase [Desulfobulbus sp.]